MTLFAMSFAVWRCKAADCRKEVEWEDAIALYDDHGSLIGFRHADCTWEDE